MFADAEIEQLPSDILGIELVAVKPKGKDGGYICIDTPSRPILMAYGFEDAQAPDIGTALLLLAAGL